MTCDIVIGYSRSVEIFNSSFIPLHQLLAYECAKSLKISSLNVNVIVLFLIEDDSTRFRLLQLFEDIRLYTYIFKALVVSQFFLIPEECAFALG